MVNRLSYSLINAHEFPYVEMLAANYLFKKQLD